MLYKDILNFLKFTEISVAILDERLVLLFILLSNIYETKPDIFEIFRTFSRYLEKQLELPETYLGNFRDICI